MGAPTSKAAICNLALDYLKTDGSVVNIDTPPFTKNESICARWYDFTRRALLRKHAWNFASKRSQIARNSTDPAFRFADAYDLPNDFIRLISLGEREDLGREKEYKVENGQILLDNSGAALKLRYVFEITDVVKFDALFVKVLALDLALNLAFKFTSGASALRNITDFLITERSEAYAIDGQEQPPKRIEKSVFLTARRLNTSRFAGKTVDFGG